MIESDSNGIPQHTPGAKLDFNKPNCDLVFSGFTDALLEVVKVGTKGAAKYTPDGWKQVPNGISRYRSAAYRHLLSNEVIDPEWDLYHLAHAAWNCLAALQLYIIENNLEGKE